jgi:hypothetical protein
LVWEEGNNKTNQRLVSYSRRLRVGEGFLVSSVEDLLPPLRWCGGTGQQFSCSGVEIQMQRLHGVSTHHLTAFARTRQVFNKPPTVIRPCTPPNTIHLQSYHTRYTHGHEYFKDDHENNRRKWFRLEMGTFLCALGGCASLLHWRKKSVVECEEKSKDIHQVVKAKEHEHLEIPIIDNTNYKEEKADVSRFWRDVFLPDLPLIVS